MIFFIPTETAYILIPLIFFTGVYLAYRDIYKAFIGVLFLMPLMHKEIFSLVVWDLLPIRVFILGLGLILGVKFLFYLKKHGFEPALKYFLNDPFLIVFSALWIFRLISIYNSTDAIRSFSLLAFFSLTFILYFAYKTIITQNTDRFYDILKIYLLVGFLTEIFAIIQY